MPSEKVAVTLTQGSTPVASSSGRTLSTLGAVVSTVKLRCAGLASTLPASSTALTSKRCAPSLKPMRFAVVLVLAVDQPPESSRYWYLRLAVVVTLSEPEKVKVGAVLLVGSLGPDVMVVSGAVVSLSGVVVSFTSSRP